MSEANHLKELVAIPSVSGDEAGIAEYLGDVCASYGADVSRVDNNIVAYFPGKNSSKALLLNGHVDTVPATDQWNEDPYTLRQHPEDLDRLIGLGSSDMKAGIATMLHIAELASEQQPPNDLWLLFSAKEETDSSGSVQIGNWLTEETQARYKTIGGLILEPTNANFVGVGHRGDTRWNVSAKGPGGHASQSFGDDIPAIEKISQLLAGLPELRHEWDQSYKDVLLGGASINPTIFTAGDTANVVPIEASAALNLRVTPRLAQALPEIRASLEAEYDLTLDQLWEPLPTLVDPSEHIYQVMRNALPEAPFKAFPGATDQFAFHAHDMPMLIYGPGDVEAMHQPNEWVRLSAIETCKKVVEQVVARY